MGDIVGIDLGTTNSVAAFKFAEVEVVTASDNSPPERQLTRSAVALNDNQLIAGQTAYNQLRADPENVVVSVKRLMGRSISDPEVHRQQAHLNYQITQAETGTEHSLVIKLGDQQYQPEDISAAILKKVVANAQAFQAKLGQRQAITKVVITVPAYFNDKQRYATRMAAVRANLEPMELLPEPTAAAISYGFRPDEASDVKTILVFDYGGGTFDASLLTVSDNQFIELGKAGNLWLGGDDIDQQIIEFVKVELAQQEEIDDLEALIQQMPSFQRVRFLADLKIAAECAKVALSSAPSVHIVPPTPLLDPLGMPLMVDVELTRDRFEAMIQPIVEPTLQIAHDAIRYADYTPDLVDVVLMVGGSSQIPLVQQLVEAEFGVDKVVVHPRPMSAVAEGAAIVSSGLTERVGTVSRDYFVQLVEGPHKVISQGDVLPVLTAQTFKTVVNDQRLIGLELLNRDDSQGIMETIGKIWLPLHKRYPEGTEVLVTLELDEQMGDLQVTAVLKNEPEMKVSSRCSRGGVDEKINDELDELIRDLNARQLSADQVRLLSQQVSQVVRLSNEIIDAKTGEERPDLRDRALQEHEALKSRLDDESSQASAWAYECEFWVQTYSFIIPQDQQERLRQIAEQLREAIFRKDVSAMQVGIQEAEQEYRRLPERVLFLQRCRTAIHNANQDSPLHGRTLNDQKEQLVVALQRQDWTQADQIQAEMLPIVEYWLNHRPATARIRTELSQ